MTDALFNMKNRYLPTLPTVSGPGPRMMQILHLFTPGSVLVVTYRWSLSSVRPSQMISRSLGKWILISEQEEMHFLRLSSWRLHFKTISTGETHPLTTVPFIDLDLDFGDISWPDTQFNGSVFSLMTGSETTKVIFSVDWKQGEVIGKYVGSSSICYTTLCLQHPSHAWI